MEIQLRTWNLQDGQALMDLCNAVDRRHLSDRIPKPYTESSAAWWLNMVQEREGKDGLFRAITVDGAIVGTISVEQKADVYRKDGEIGYFLATPQWSRGIMTQAVREVCALAFRELDLVRITGLVYGENIASQRVLEKNGFLREGVLRSGVIKDGVLHDLFVYGRLR